jgi:DNA polymerase epsilon subunit 3
MDSISLPLSSIVKVLKEALPAHVSVSKDVKVSLQRASALFVLYVTNTANQLAKQGKRSTLTADDIMAALEELEFDPLLEPLQEFLEKWRKQHEKARQKIKEAAQAARARAADGQPSEETKKKSKKESKAGRKRKSNGGNESQENSKSPAKKSKQQEEILIEEEEGEEEIEEFEPEKQQEN